MQNLPVPVSVIIPCFNASKYLGACVESINAGRRPSEILVIDDASTDDSLLSAAALAREWSNVRVLRRDVNGGAAAARRDGFNSASCDWVAIVDADDTVEEDAVSSAYENAVAANADICIWDLWRVDETGRTWPSIVLNPGDFPKTGRQAVLDTLGGWRIHPLGVARKDLYLRAYMGFSQTCVNADELLTRLLLANAGKVTFCTKKYLYRVNPASTTRNLSPKRLTSLDSYIWLLDFIRSYPEVSAETVGKDAIAQAWSFWRQRHHFGLDRTAAALSAFLPKFLDRAKVHNWVWKSPKHTVALLMLWAVVKARPHQ